MTYRKRTYEEMKASPEKLDRLVVYIANLSPHNLWEGRYQLDEYLKRYKPIEFFEFPKDDYEA